MSTNDVRVEVYRSFVDRGVAPSVGEIATSLGMYRSDVAVALRELADDDVIVLQRGSLDVWLAHPFAAPSAPFKVASGERSWDAICIWDGLGILEVVGSDGDVRTNCPDCAEPLTVSVTNGEARAPDDYVVHFGVPAARWYEDVAYT